MIHCFGNSHINTFSNCSEMSYVPNNNFFKLYHLGPTIAFNFYEHHYPNILHNLQFIDKNDYISLIVGEVDCRLHLPLQADKQNRKDVDVVDECVIRLFRCYNHLTSLGYKCIVYSTHPTTSYICQENKDYIYDSMERRNSICCMWNLKCQELCGIFGIPYVSFYDLLIDDNNKTDMSKYHDYCHIKSNLIFDELLKRTAGVLL